MRSIRGKKSEAQVETEIVLPSNLVNPNVIEVPTSTSNNGFTSMIAAPELVGAAMGRAESLPCERGIRRATSQIVVQIIASPLPLAA